MKQKKILLFSKANGVLIGELDGDSAISGLDLSIMDIKTVEMDGELGEYWYGDYQTGEVRAREDKPLIAESWLKYQTNLKILNAYPIHTQLNLLIDLIDANASIKTSEWEEFKAFLGRMRKEHNDQVEVYRSNPDVYTYVSEEEEKINAQKRADLF